jgi:hypothetical protein
MLKREPGSAVGTFDHRQRGLLFPSRQELICRVQSRRMLPIVDRVHPCNDKAKARPCPARLGLTPTPSLARHLEIVDARKARDIQ